MAIMNFNKVYITQYYKVTGTTVGGIEHLFDLSVTNRATYIGEFDGIFDISVSISSYTNAGANDTIYFVIAKNGTVEANSLTSVINSNSRPYSSGIQYSMLLNNGDYIELWCRNTSALNNIIVGNLQLKISRV